MTYAKPAPIAIPTEPIGSIPRTPDLIQKFAQTDGEDPALAALYEDAVRDTIERFEATGSRVVTDGEQRKYHNFLTYCVHGLPNTSADGFKIPFSDGHTRRMLRLTRGPFRYLRYADSYLDVAMRYAHVPVKQAVISASALSMMYRPKAFQIIRGNNSSKICCASMKPRYDVACKKERIRFRSTLPKRGSP